MWPIRSFKRGWRSNAPDSARRSTWTAVSACQPQPRSTAGTRPLPADHRNRRRERSQAERRDGYRAALRAAPRGREPARTPAGPRICVDRAVDQRAFEPKVAHGPLQFVGRRRGTGHRQVGEAGEALRLGRNQTRQTVVVISRHRHAVGAGDQLRSWPRNGKNLHGDSGGVHRRHPVLASIGQSPRIDPAKPGRSRRRPSVSFQDAGVDASEEVGKDEMLFDADNAHSGTFLATLRRGSRPDRDVFGARRLRGVRVCAAKILRGEARGAGAMAVPRRGRPRRLHSASALTTEPSGRDNRGIAGLPCPLAPRWRRRGWECFPRCLSAPAGRPCPS